MLLHAQCFWPEYISTMLWPFALLAAADCLDNLHIDMKGINPEMKKSSVAGSSIKLKNYHTFGCPVYILDARLQKFRGIWSSEVGSVFTLGYILGSFTNTCW